MFFEKILSGLEVIWTYIVSIFTSNITELKIYDIIIAAAVVILCLYILKVVLKALKAGCIAIGKMFKSMFGRAKRKCESIQCKTCGRNLASCVCQKNLGLSYRKRLRLYRKENKK